MLRRGHFKRLDEIERPPWDLTLHAEIHQMAMDEHDALNPERGTRGRVPGVVDEDEDEDEDATSTSTGVTLSAEVSPVGHGFFVDGEIESRAVTECDRCGCAHVGFVRAPVKAWLDERAGDEDDGGGEYEVVPFPVTRDECDLTGAHEGFAADERTVRVAVRCVREHGGGGGGRGRVRVQARARGLTGRQTRHCEGPGTNVGVSGQVKVT